MDKRREKTRKRQLEQTSSTDNSRSASPASRDFAANDNLYSTDGGANLSRSKRQRIGTSFSSEIPPPLTGPLFSDSSRRRDSHPAQESQSFSESFLSHPEKPREISFTDPLNHEPYLTLSYEENSLLDNNSIKKLGEKISEYEKDIISILTILRKSKEVLAYKSILELLINKVKDLTKVKIEHFEIVDEQTKNQQSELKNKENTTYEHIDKIQRLIEEDKKSIQRPSTLFEEVFLFQEETRRNIKGREREVEELKKQITEITSQETFGKLEEKREKTKETLSSCCNNLERYERAMKALESMLEKKRGTTSDSNTHRLHDYSWEPEPPSHVVDNQRISYPLDNTIPGTGMNCLIHSILRASASLRAENSIPDDLIGAASENVRRYLVDNGEAREGEMLEQEQGIAVINLLRHQRVIDGRAVRVYHHINSHTTEGPYPITNYNYAEALSGSEHLPPIQIFLSNRNQHFSAILSERPITPEVEQSNAITTEGLAIVKRNEARAKRREEGEENVSDDEILTEQQKKKVETTNASNAIRSRGLAIVKRNKARAKRREEGEENVSDDEILTEQQKKRVETANASNAIRSRGLAIVKRNKARAKRREEGEENVSDDEILTEQQKKRVETTNASNTTITEGLAIVKRNEARAKRREEGEENVSDDEILTEQQKKKVETANASNAIRSRGLAIVKRNKARAKRREEGEENVSDDEILTEQQKKRVETTNASNTTITEGLAIVKRNKARAKRREEGEENVSDDEILTEQQKKKVETANASNTIRSRGLAIVKRNKARAKRREEGEENVSDDEILTEQQKKKVETTNASNAIAKERRAIVKRNKARAKRREEGEENVSDDEKLNNK